MKIPFAIYSDSDKPLKEICCCCGYYDHDGNLVDHKDYFFLFKCQNPKCDCWSCKEHFSDGLCYGCYVEKGINQGEYIDKSKNES